ncbi:MAG: hypothetical protein QOI80_3257 [Solirubrobacteraceae bacterium]|nr:hypothetical protein [Solirubrobacteraceae bacterium]
MSDEPIHIDDVTPQRWEVGELAATRWRLGAAAAARTIGVAVIAIDPGKRATPPHSHADEEEQVFVLEGGGLSYQTAGSKDARAYEIRSGDFLWHPAGGDAHTLIAGPDGLKVLIVAEGSRTNITYLPRTKQFWLGPRWSPADSPPPFVADARLDPLAIPEPAERPASIKHLDELELHEGRDGELAYATRHLTTKEEAQLVLAHDRMPPDTHTTELHFHSTREEAWYVLSGSGHARLGGERFALRPGSFFLRRPNGGVGHRIEVGPEGMDLLTMGDLVGGDLWVYPERNTVHLAKGVEVRYEAT